MQKETSDLHHTYLVEATVNVVTPSLLPKLLFCLKQLIAPLVLHLYLFDSLTHHQKDYTPLRHKDSSIVSNYGLGNYKWDHPDQ